LGKPLTTHLVSDILRIVGEQKSGNDAVTARRRTMTRKCEVCGQTTGRDSGDGLCWQCANEGVNGCPVDSDVK
jgi:hypothetical protein